MKKIIIPTISLTSIILALPITIVSCSFSSFDFPKPKFELYLYKLDKKDEINNSITYSFDFKLYKYENDVLDGQEKWILKKEGKFNLNGDDKTKYQDQFDNFCRSLANEFEMINFKEQVKIIKDNFN